MANHATQQIREAAATLLTGLTTTGSHVFQNRKRPLGDSKLPCLLLYDGDDSVTELYGAPIRQCRRFQLIVRGVVKQSADVDDKLATISKEVEVALGGNPTLSGLVKDVNYAGRNADFDEDMELPVGQAELRFDVDYQVVRSAPDVLI